MLRHVLDWHLLLLQFDWINKKLRFLGVGTDYLLDFKLKYIAWVGNKMESVLYRHFIGYFIYF